MSRQDGTDCACELKISHESFAGFSPSLPLSTAQQSEGQTNMFTPRAVSFHISIKATLEVGDLKCVNQFGETSTCVSLVLSDEASYFLPMGGC